MPRARPQLSITLPRNFTFHYTEGDGPKTPEHEVAPPLPKSPRAYRIKRRSRPAVSTSTFATQDGPQDVAIPSIETTMPVESTRPILQARATEPAQGFLAPAPARPFLTTPRTPSIKRSLLADTWSNAKDIGESLSRPMSACSMLSDSSEESDYSLQSYQSKGGSCTSPESDAADPFGTQSIRKPKVGSRPRLEACLFTPQQKKSRVLWTAEMDRHLWTTYHLYLQDPTVTPFKLLPGVAPPLGVCHRVTREARRTWKSPKLPCKSPDVSIPLGREPSAIKLSGSPDTITTARSGSNTPTALPVFQQSAWPKSGSSTRRRLRELCKRKPTIAPHYQRLMQSRSPSPFSSSSPRPQSRSSRVVSPFATRKSPSTFNTREIHLSLTTSTADTMQPDGPLAQLAKPSANETVSNDEWFNEPPVPWASPTAIPSDVGPIEESLSAGQLGSPFNGFHTWGPSRSRQHLRPSTPRTHTTDASTMGPTLRSPVRLHDTFPYPSMNKRRAQHQLEDELSPGGTDIRRELLDNLFGGPAEGRQRRVRNRGFSLGDMTNEARLAELFTPPSADEHMNGSDQLNGPAQYSTLPLPPKADPVNRLGSPFAGIGTRPSRRTPRHMATASLSAYDPSSFASIEQRLNQGDDSELGRLLRGQRDFTSKTTSSDSPMQ